MSMLFHGAPPRVGGQLQRSLAPTAELNVIP